LTHVFHHIPDANAFFKEAERVLVPGGVISMIESLTRRCQVFFQEFSSRTLEDDRGMVLRPKRFMMDANQGFPGWCSCATARNLRTPSGLEIEAMSFLPG